MCTEGGGTALKTKCDVVGGGGIATGSWDTVSHGGKREQRL